MALFRGFGFLVGCLLSAKVHFYGKHSGWSSLLIIWRYPSSGLAIVKK